MWAKPSAARDPAVAELARTLDGDVVPSGSTRYAQARALWDIRFDVLRPRAIAYCANAADVRRAVRWGHRHGVRVVPRSGGHSFGGYSSGNGVLVADVSRLGRVSAAPATAAIGAGARLLDVYDALSRQGATIPGGSCAGVGIAGLTLGGGIGYASRLLGTAADSLRALRIVLADGEELECSSSAHPDLFWACRGGGGGNFGIVTELTFATHPVSTVARYEIEWPWAQAGLAVAAWQALAPHAPDELYSVLDLIAPGPVSNAARSHVVSAGQYFGSEADLLSLIEPLTSTGAPTRVVTRTSPYFEAVLHWAGCRDAGACIDRRLRFAAKSDYVREPLPAAAIATLVGAIAARQEDGAGAVYLDAYGGAINRVPPAATAFVHRRALFSIQYTAQWSGAAAPGLGWLRHVHDRMRPYVSGSAYQNYIDPQLPGWAEAYYGANLPRLKAVKRKVDPHGFFRFRQSIPAP